MATPTSTYSLVQKIVDQKTTEELRLAKKIATMSAKKTNIRAEINGLNTLLTKITADKI